MKYISQISLLIILLIGVSSMLCFGQSVIAADGGEGGTAKVRIEWTLGEFAISTLTTPNGLLTQGFHQPRLHITQFPEPPKAASNLTAENPLKITLAPNPVNDLLNIKLEREKAMPIHLSLLDANGRILHLEKTAAPTGLELDFSKYPSGFYFLQFRAQDGTPLETYKISKQ